MTNAIACTIACIVLLVAVILFHLLRMVDDAETEQNGETTGRETEKIPQEQEGCLINEQQE